jgi:riboflavin synthase alpha subunit
MFTGIIESLGKVESLQNVGGDVRLRIQTDLICLMYIWVTQLQPMGSVSQ